MNIYTSDGLLVEQVGSAASATAAALAPHHGQQLISIYRLFLQLHHAGNGDMRLKDMLKPEAADTGAEGGPEALTAGGGGDRRSAGGRNVGGGLNHNWSSMPSMPEAASAYASTAAAISTGTPYPMFLLSANAIAETHRLRGFPDASAGHRASAVTESKNNNRSANGCEEIPVRWSLLAKQPLSAYNTGTAATTATTSAGAANAPHSRSADGATGRGEEEATAGVEGDAHGSAATSPATRAFASGWVAAELQVQTTRHVLTCTATEMSLAGEESRGGDDGDVPLVFCCGVLSGTA